MDFGDNPPFNPYFVGDSGFCQPQDAGEDDNHANPPSNPCFVGERGVCPQPRAREDAAPNNQETEHASQRQAAGAAVAGAVAGVALSGPVAGAVAGGAAAYAATRTSGAAGQAARRTGDVVIAAGEKAKDANDRHGISTRSLALAKVCLLECCTCGCVVVGRRISPMLLSACHLSVFA